MILYLLELKNEIFFANFKPVIFIAYDILSPLRLYDVFIFI